MERRPSRRPSLGAVITVSFPSRILSSLDDDDVAEVEPEKAEPASASFGRFLPPAWLLVSLILAATFLLKLRHLDHTALTQWDEAHHAVVARNLLKHPLRPTLYDVPYLPYDSRKWSENHVWLHKPILPLWQMALSLAVLGFSTFAVRLPSAILSTAAAWLTYLIGKELLDRPTAVIAAGLQAINPFVFLLVHGYQFGDHIDVALLFWVEVGVYYLVRSLRTGSTSDVKLAGIAQGLAYLSKSYFAALVSGLALSVWLAQALALHHSASPPEKRMSLRRLGLLLGATLLTVAPWTFYCLVNYPGEIAYEEAQIWRHLTAKVEIWGAPWDRVAFDYLICIYGVWYTPVLVAGIVLLPSAIARRDLGLCFLYAWGLGVIVPHLLAVTKTPSATVIAMPALLLLLAALIVRALRRELVPLVALTAVLTIGVVVPAVVNTPGVGFPDKPLGVLREAWWVMDHVAFALAAVALAAALAAWFRPQLAKRGVTLKSVLGPAVFFSIGALIWLGSVTLSSAVAVTSRNENDQAIVEIGAYVNRELPANTALICEDETDGGHLALMFYSGRSSYALRWRTMEDLCQQIVRAGGAPYAVSSRALPRQRVFTSRDQRRSVYLCVGPRDG